MEYDRGPLIPEHRDVVTEFGIGDHPAQLLVLPARRSNQVGHGHWRLLISSEEGGSENDVADVPARDLQLSRQESEVDIVRQR